MTRAAGASGALLAPEAVPPGTPSRLAEPVVADAPVHVARERPMARAARSLSWPWSSSARVMRSRSIWARVGSDPSARPGGGRRRGRSEGRQVGELDRAPRPERAGPLQEVLQLADVARQVVGRRAATASGAMPVSGRPRRRPISRRKCVRRGGDVLVALAQRRHAHADDVEAVVEVLAEDSRSGRPPRGRGSSRRRCGRRPTAASSPSRRGGPRRSWRTRSSLACSASGSSPISSRKSVPPCAGSNRPDAVARPRRERAAHVAEQLALEQVASGSRRS